MQDRLTISKIIYFMTIFPCNNISSSSLEINKKNNATSFILENFKSHRITDRNYFSQSSLTAKLGNENVRISVELLV